MTFLVTLFGRKLQDFKKTVARLAYCNLGGDFLGDFQTLWTSVYLNTIIKKVLLQVNALIIVQWKDAKRDSLAPTNYLATVACTRARKNSPAPCAADALSAPIT